MRSPTTTGATASTELFFVVVERRAYWFAIDGPIEDEVIDDILATVTFDPGSAVD